MCEYLSEESEKDSILSITLNSDGLEFTTKKILGGVATKGAGPMDQHARQQPKPWTLSSKSYGVIPTPLTTTIERKSYSEVFTFLKAKEEQKDNLQSICFLQCHRIYPPLGQPAQGHCRAPTGAVCPKGSLLTSYSGRLITCWRS